MEQTSRYPRSLKLTLSIVIITLLQFLAPPLARAERIRFLSEDREAMQARIDIIQQAKKEILVEYFSVWNDDESIAAMALLVDAARRGVKVRMILDSISMRVPAQVFRAMMDDAIGRDGAKNLEIRLYNPFGWAPHRVSYRDHAKMIIIDGDILLTGGRNIGDKYFGFNDRRNFNDLDVLMKGGVVKKAREDFSRVWKSDIVKPVMLYIYSPEAMEPIACAAREDSDSCMRQQEASAFQIKEAKRRLTQFLLLIRAGKRAETYTDAARFDTGTNWFRSATQVSGVSFHSQGAEEYVSHATSIVDDEVMKIIGSAKNEVEIVSPYVIPTDNVLKTFADLLRRGIRVRLVTNSLNSTDNILAQAGYANDRDMLIRMGFEIYEYRGPDTVHATAAIVDGKHILVGTYNIDPRSSFINREISIALTDVQATPLVGELKRVIQGFRSESRLVAQGGREYNAESRMEGVGFWKRQSFEAARLFVPLIRGQL